MSRELMTSVELLAYEITRILHPLVDLKKHITNEDYETSLLCLSDADQAVELVADHLKMVRASLSAPQLTWTPCPYTPRKDWRAKDVLVKLKSGEELVAHWAQDLSGEDQPPFIGWFKQGDREFLQLEQPKEWRLL